MLFVDLSILEKLAIVYFFYNIKLSKMISKVETEE